MPFESPLVTWFESAAARRRFRRGCLGRRAIVLAPRDKRWRSIAPGFAESLAMAASGLPFQIAADRRYDRAADRRRLTRALASGATVFLPQVHQVLPRLMRLMVALRTVFLGPFREECSFLFLVDGKGRQGMGLHHDGGVDAFWLQLEGRRTVTIGPQVAPRTPQEIPGRPPDGDPRWVTLTLEPGTLFYMPPRTPHEVICHTRSLALSLTWGAATAARRRSGRARAESLTDWDVASGHVTAMPPASRRRLWTQVPVLADAARGTGDGFRLWTPDGALRCPASARPLARQLAVMPTLRRDDVADPEALALMIDRGILAPRELPLRIAPDDVRALDGWNY